MPTRDQIARQIIDTCLAMNASGLNQGTSGNISYRFDGGMLVTPSGIPYHKLSENHIVYVDQNGESETGKVPSTEWRFHLDALKTRPELNAVIHTHSLNSTAVSILNHPIPPVHYMISATGNTQIPCVPYATFGTTELSQNVSAGLAKCKATLIQHHGLIVMEANLEKALWLAEEVEVLAKLYLKLLPLGEVPVLSEKEILVVIEKFKDYGLRKT
ncbi:MAG: L-fuculose-phosphate aldolase [Planctomycetes bacterium]|nr:L-fuculose-phosphate aldolase [Planctomycetota bacterium]